MPQARVKECCKRVMRLICQHADALAQDMRASGFLRLQRIALHMYSDDTEAVSGCQPWKICVLESRGTLTGA